jgi:hypothetical protein
MASYYKYAERQADSYVDWSEIGKNITDMLKTENQIREDKKAAIDKASREFGEQLSNSPTGEHQGLNEWTLSYANDAQQARLMQDRLLKSGQLKLKDYNVMRQNINDGTTQVFNLSKEYQEEYKVKMERMKAQDPNMSSQELESWLMGTVEGFANFSKSKILINPTDFQISVGMMEPDPDNKGVMKLTNNVATVNELRNRIKSKFDKFNTQQATQEVSSKLAEYITADIKRGSATRAGYVETLEDAMQRPGYQKALDEAINSYFTNPYNVSSVLTEDIGVDKNGQAYTFTFNADEAKGKSNVILLERDQSGLPKPKFTKEQEDAVRGYMKGQIEQQIKHKEEIRPFQEPQKPQPQQWQYEAGRGVQTAKTEGNMLAKLYSGDSGEIQAAVDHFNGLGTVRAVNRTTEGVDVTLNDGTTKTIRFKNPDGTVMSQNDFVRAATKLLVGDNADVNAVLQGAVATGRTAFNATGTASAAAQRNNPSEMYASTVGSTISTALKPSLFQDKSAGFKGSDGKKLTEEQVATKLNASLSSLGFSALVPWTAGNYIVIKNKDGVESAEISLDNPNDAMKAIEGFMISNVPGKDEEAQMLYLNSLKSKGIIKAPGQQAAAKPAVKAAPDAQQRIGGY